MEGEKRRAWDRALRLVVVVIVGSDRRVGSDEAAMGAKERDVDRAF